MNTKTQKNRIENGFDSVKPLQRNGESTENEALPRIVITADDIVMLPTAGKTLALSRDEIDCIVRLTQALRRNME
jgi:hypothetical protein